MIDFGQLPDKKEQKVDLDGIPDSQDNSLRGAYRMMNKSSDEYAKQIQSSKTTGLPLTTVVNKPYEAANLASEPDWSAVSPEVKKLISSDLNLFKIAKDDVENLSALEKSAKAIFGGAVQATLGISKSIHQTPETIARGSEYLSQSFEELTGIPRWLDPIRAFQYTGEYFSRGKIPGTSIETGGMSDIAREIGRSEEILAENVDLFGRLSAKGVQAEEAFQGLLSGDVKPTVEVITDPEAWAGFIGQAAPSLYTAYKSGGSIPFMAWLEGMEASNTAIEFEQKTGQKISPEQFSQAVAQSATINAMLEKFGLDKVLGGGKTLTGFIRGALSEGGTEALQQFNSNASAYIAYNPDQPLSEGILGSFMGGFGTGGPAGAAKSIADRVSAADRAQESSAALDSLVTSATESKVRNRPGGREAVAKIIDSVAGEDSEIYLNADDAAVFFQSNPEALDIVQTQLPDVAENIKEAMTTGEDIRIPAKDYVSYLAEYHKDLSGKVRIGADGMSLEEAQNWRQEEEETFKREADKVITDRMIEDDADTVYQAIKDDIIATGKFTPDVADKYAALHKAFAISMSDRTGLTPSEVYERYGLRVRVPPPAAEPTPSPGDVADAGGTLFQNAIPEESEVEALRARVLELETELRTSPKTGLRNHRAFEEDHETGWPVVAALDMDGLKRLNDALGHTGADEVLRALGGALLKAEHPEMRFYHLSGDEFAARIKDEAMAEKSMAELQNILDSINVEVDVEDTDGNIRSYVYEGIGVSYGTGKTYEIADNRATLNKAERLKLGKREEARGDESRPPRRLRETTPGSSEGGAVGQQGQLSLFQQESQAGEKGSITFGRDITQDPSVISLLENADLSTFLHESGHFFFQVMTDMASQEDSPQQIKDDLQTLFDWHGVKDITEWNAMSDEDRRVHHEKFARGFEAYLFEGKSPSVEMSGLFHRFRDWLVSVYKSVKSLKVDLTYEVRGVMSRLIATDDQIETANATAAYRPLFDSAEQAGMSKAEWEKYSTENQSIDQESKEYLDARLMKDMKWLSGAKSRILKDLQRTANAQRKAVRAEAAEEIKNKQVYQAIRYLKTGEMTTPDGEEIKVTEGNKINKQKVLEMVSGELAAVDLTPLKGMTSESGLDPDIISQIFGYDNGDQLVRDILSSPPLKEAIDARTDEIMLQRYGDINSPEKLEQAADEAVHSKARAKLAMTEYNALAKALGNKVILTRAAKEYAELKISRKKVRDAIKMAPYKAAEARAARNAEKAMRSADIEQAAEHKRSQVLNMMMYRASSDANQEVDKILNYLKKFSRSTIRKNLRGDTVDQIDGLLGRFDLRKAEPKEREPLGDWVQAEADRLSASVPDIDSMFLNEGFRRPYRDLTLEEFRGLRDTIKQLEHLARREQKMYMERRNMGFEEERQAILSELKEVNPDAFEEDLTPKPFRKDTKPILKELSGKFRSKFDAEFINYENILDMMTADKGKQIFDSLFGRLSEAADNQTRMMKDLAEFLKPQTNAYSYKERMAMSMAASRVYIPEVGEYFTRDKRLAVALFYGSEDGRQRLRDGNEYSDYQVQAILKTLDERDLDFVEAMWAVSDEKIWPQLESLNKRTKGISPPKIKPASYVVGGRVMRGGYVPLVYDGDLDTRAFDLNTDDAIKEIRGGTTTQAATRQSASKERVKQVKRALDLSLAGIAYKINETVHDITHREAVTDTYRLLQSKRIGNAIRNIAGPDVYKAMLIKVRELAVKPSVPRGVTERTLWYLRRNTMINMMGLSFNTVAINVLGASPAIRRVGPARFIRALQQFSTSPKARYEWVLEKSPYMRERVDGFDRDLSTEVNRFTGKGSLGPTMTTWFSGLAVMDRMVTLPTWLAAYQKSMDESNDESVATQYADRIVRQTNGSGRILDIAKVSGGVGPAGEFKRILTMYYNFFSAQLWMMVKSKRLSERYWNEGKRAKAAMEFTLTTLAVIVIPSTLEAIARGNCGDDPDATDYLYCTGRSSALFAGAMFPILRDMVPYTWSQFDSETPAFGVRLSPIENAMETIARTPGSVADVVTGDETESDIRTILRGIGFAFGLPGFQAGRTVEGYQALMDGDTENPAVLLTGAR